MGQDFLVDRLRRFCAPADPTFESSVVVIQGIAASVMASVLFGAIYYLSPLLAPLDGEQIFGWRVLLTLPFTTAFLLWRGQGGRVAGLWARARAHWSYGPLLLVCSALLGLQLWLFMWAPLHGRALPVSLGYFLLPLVMVVTGRVVFQERLTPGQKLAAALAAVGVALEFLRVGSLSWETLVVSLGYPVYFMLRRRLGADHLGGHWLDMALLAPAALWFMLREPSSLDFLPAHPALMFLLPMLGILSAMALALYMAASRWLPMGLFGLLTYVEPVLLVVVALLLGERLAPGQWATYAFVFAAVAVLVLDGIRQLKQERAGLKPE
jgi:chloramphenicol-sensitive protein RarD